MKRFVIIVSVLFMMASMVFADSLLKYGKPEGDWMIRSGRLYQKDVDASRAKAWVNVPQNDSMIYEFTMRYEGGIEDGHGGVGLHILSDSFPTGQSWGMGDSWLLWLNYDESPINPSIPQGLSAQLYKSTSDSEMEIVQSISLRAIEPIAVKYLNSDIPVKLTYLLGNGRITISDPRGNTGGWFIDIPGGYYDTGQYIAVRTNGVKMSFTSPDVDL